MMRRKMTPDLEQTPFLSEREHKSSVKRRRSTRPYLIAGSCALFLVFLIIGRSSSRCDGGQKLEAEPRSIGRPPIEVTERKPVPLAAAAQKSRPASTWVSTAHRIDQIFLTTPYDKFRYTFLHALSARHQATAKVSQISGPDDAIRILGFIEETPFPRPKYTDGQVSVPQDLSFIESVVCRFLIGGQRAQTTAIRMLTKDSDDPHTDGERLYQLLCPIPSAILPLLNPTDSAESGFLDPRKGNSDNLVLTLDFRLKGATTVQHVITLRRQERAPKNAGKNRLAICLPPAQDWNQTSAEASLEWREHHRKVGVETVHWYGREMTLSSHVESLNKHLGVKDTFRLADRISPETLGTDILKDKGEYADQILYQTDCHLRSKTSEPSEWLAFIGPDEYLLPLPFSSDGLIDMLNVQDPNLGGLCMGRTHVSKSPNSPAHVTRLGNFTHIREPASSDGQGNAKCLYRTSALGVPGIPGPVQLLNGATSEYVWEESSVKLLHFGSHKALGNGSTITPFKPDMAFQNHISELGKVLKLVT